MKSSRDGDFDTKEHTMLRILDVMKKTVITVEKGTPIMLAVEKLVVHNISGLPVVDDSHRVVGILSEKDVLALAVRTHDGSYDFGDTDLKVEDFMTKDVVTVDAHDSFTSLCSCLIKIQFRRVPVVTDGKLVGIVSRRDIIASTMRICAW